MKVIIVGAGAIGAHLANLFSKIRQDIVIIDDDEEKLEHIQANCDLMTLHAPSNPPIQALKDAGIKHAELFIAVTPDENLNVNLCVLATQDMVDSVASTFGLSMGGHNALLEKLKKLQDEFG